MDIQTMGIMANKLEDLIKFIDKLRTTQEEQTEVMRTHFELADIQRDSLKDLLEKIKNKEIESTEELKRLNQNIKDIEELLEEIKSSCEESVDSIKDGFDEVVEKLKESEPKQIDITMIVIIVFFILGFILGFVMGYK